MRNGGIRLGRFYGIDVTAKLGVLVIAAFLTWSLAVDVLPAGAPDHVSVTYWSVGFIVAVLFMFSLLAHELGHSLVARRNGIRVRGITLWLFGGISEFDADPSSPGAEFRITVAGPATSLGLGALGVLASLGIESLGGPAVYSVGLGWFGFINLFLGVFNLLPGAPLDGGRLIASVLWKLRGDRLRARIGAAQIGKVVGCVIAVLGVVEMYAIGSGSGLLTMFVGWFLFSAARSEQTHYEVERSLGQLQVGSVMESHPRAVSSLSTLAQLADNGFLTDGKGAVAVLDMSGRPVATIEPSDVARVPREEWANTSTLAIRDPSQRLVTTVPGEMVTDLLRRMAAEGERCALVMHDGVVVGLIGPEQIRRALSTGRASRGFLSRR